MLQKTKYSLVLTNREIDVINKKLSHERLTQQDSNYLSKYVRPKLKQLTALEPGWILNRLEYNQKALSIERKIKSLILKNLKNVLAILVYGSAVYNNYIDYNDIDVMVLVRRKTWKKLGEKYTLIRNIKAIAIKSGIKLDLKMHMARDVYYSYPSNIALIFQLADYKKIYGTIKLPGKVDLSKLDLRMHQDYSFSIIEDIKEEKLDNISSMDIYSAIRNLVILKLILEKRVDNKLVISRICDLLGRDAALHLKNNTTLISYKKIGHIILTRLYNQVEIEIKSLKGNLTWERMP